MKGGSQENVAGDRKAVGGGVYIAQKRWNDKTVTFGIRKKASTEREVLRESRPKASQDRFSGAYSVSKACRIGVWTFRGWALSSRKRFKKHVKLEEKLKKNVVKMKKIVFCV